MATHSSILSRGISWTEEVSRLQSMGSHRVRHNWATNIFTMCRVTIQKFCHHWLLNICWIPTMCQIQFEVQRQDAWKIQPVLYVYSTSGALNCFLNRTLTNIQGSLNCVLSDIFTFQWYILSQYQNVYYTHRKAHDVYITSVQNYLKTAMNYRGLPRWR